MFTIPALLAEAADRFGDETAVVDGDRSVGYRTLSGLALDAAARLRAHGVRRGDRVGVCTAKSLDQVVAILGVLLADAVLVPVLPGLKAENIAHIVGDCGMSAAVTDPSRAGELASAAPDLPLLLAADLAGFTAAPRSGLAASGGGSRRDGPAPALVSSLAIGADLAGIIYSSGSTGRPKGIMVTHRNLTDGARLTAGYLGTSRGDRIGCVLSLNFDYGLNQLWQSLLVGARLCLHTLVFPADLFGFLATERITVLPVMPVIITRMFDPRLLRRRPEEDLSGVRYVSTSGGAVSPRMLADLAETFPAARVFLMYGLTEAFRSTYLEPEQLARRPTSIGRAIPDVEILVLDDAGREVGPGERGELVHRGGCIAKGYWNAPDATARRFRTLPEHPGETVVFSGDVVTRDEEGYLYFVGRRDAMIKTSGFRVSPSEIEEVAVRFPGVEACVAVGLPNVAIGEDVALVYTAAGGVDGEPAEPELRQFLRRELPSHMVPRFVHRKESLPITGNEGKLDRAAVREALLTDLPRRR